MTRSELIEALTGRFCADFADVLAARVTAAGAFDALYAAATEPHEAMPQSLRHRVAFRAAYVLERLYFESPADFEPYADRFCRVDFPACSDPSARRHFGKIMADRLRRCPPDADVLGPIAETAGAWAIDPDAKVAVRVWAIEVLRACRDRVPWVADAWADLMAALAHDPAPAIACCLRRKRRSA